MISPYITSEERALAARMQARAPRAVWDNPLWRLKEATGLRYDARAVSGAVRLDISHCEIVKGLPRYNSRTVYEPVGVYPTPDAMQSACAEILARMT